MNEGELAVTEREHVKNMFWELKTVTIVRKHRKYAKNVDALEYINKHENFGGKILKVLEWCIRVIKG